MNDRAVGAIAEGLEPRPISGRERLPTLYGVILLLAAITYLAAPANDTSSGGRRMGHEALAILGAYSSVVLRFALGASFLSAVADRFGLWGPFGKPNVAWGSFSRFVAYTEQLNWFAPKAMIPALAILATCAEAILGILLVLGWQTRIAALLSGVLLLIFAVTMTVALGIKAPLDYSVFTAMGGALLLASLAEYPFSIDHLLR